MIWHQSEFKIIFLCPCILYLMYWLVYVSQFLFGFPLCRAVLIVFFIISRRPSVCPWVMFHKKLSISLTFEDMLTKFAHNVYAYKLQNYKEVSGNSRESSYLDCLTHWRLSRLSRKFRKILTSVLSPYSRNTVFAPP